MCLKSVDTAIKLPSVEVTDTISEDSVISRRVVHALLSLFFLMYLEAIFKAEINENNRKIVINDVFRSLITANSAKKTATNDG